MAHWTNTVSSQSKSLVNNSANLENQVTMNELTFMSVHFLVGVNSIFKHLFDASSYLGFLKSLQNTPFASVINSFAPTYN